MKAILLTCLLALSCTGCALLQPLTAEPPVVVKTKVVLLEVPAEMLEIPPPQKLVKPLELTDKDFVTWLFELEQRAQEIEKRLRTIKLFQDIRKKDLEKVTETK